MGLFVILPISYEQIFKFNKLFCLRLLILIYICQLSADYNTNLLEIIEQPKFDEFGLSPTSPFKYKVFIHSGVCWTCFSIIRRKSRHPRKVDQTSVGTVQYSY